MDHLGKFSVMEELCGIVLCMTHAMRFGNVEGGGGKWHAHDIRAGFLKYKTPVRRSDMPVPSR